MSESTRVPERVREIVAEALARSPSDVRLDSILMADLGAESLDFLDIVFKLEHEFHIQITRGEMERAARGEMSDEEFAPGFRRMVARRQGKRQPASTRGCGRYKSSASSRYRRS